MMSSIGKLLIAASKICYIAHIDYFNKNFKNVTTHIRLFRRYMIPAVHSHHTIELCAGKLVTHRRE